MKLSSVEMADTFRSLIRCRHGDKAIATSPRTAGIGHHFGANNLSILAEKVLQICCSSCGGQSTDPQIPTRTAADTTFFIFNDWLYIFFFLKRTGSKSGSSISEGTLKSNDEASKVLSKPSPSTACSVS